MWINLAQMNCIDFKDKVTIGKKLYDLMDAIEIKPSSLFWSNDTNVAYVKDDPSSYKPPPYLF